MTEHEALTAIETWIKTYSLFTAKAVSITPEENGVWVALVECSELIWEQKVSPDGVVSPPVWMD